MTLPAPKTRFEKYHTVLETVRTDDGRVVVRLGLEPESPRWQRANDHEDCTRELGFGMDMMPTEALEFALGIIHESWAAARGRLGPLLELGLKMGWLTEDGIYADPK